jgi:putative ABC transport system substrate-binding protein
VIRRRHFFTLLGGAAAWPLAARAQQTAAPVIGILMGGWAESFAPFEPAFRKGLNEGGFPDGSNVPFESRRANGQVDRLPALAADLVGRRPAVIATPEAWSARSRFCFGRRKVVPSLPPPPTGQRATAAR